MTKKIKEIKKCKNVCKFCERYFEDDDEYFCHEYYDEVPNCVTGGIETVYHKCVNHNKGGCCNKYYENKRLRAENDLLKAIKKFKDKMREYNGYSESRSMVEWLANQTEDAIDICYKQYLNFYESGDRFCYKYDHEGNYTKHYKKWKVEHD